MIVLTGTIEKILTPYTRDEQTIQEFILKSENSINTIRCNNLSQKEGDNVSCEITLQGEKVNLPKSKDYRVVNILFCNNVTTPYSTK